MDKPSDSIGIVKKQTFTFAEPPNELVLESGKKIGPVTIAYETYGELNKTKSNAILVLHALSGGAHAAGYYSDEDIKGEKKKFGWWDIMIGPGKAMDTNKYFIICSNVIGGCYGSTGPASINPKTNKPYGLDFPVVTISDMVKAQRHLLEYLGIEKLVTVIGGSMGGMQAIEWTVQFPDIPKSAIVIASCTSQSAQEIAFDAVGRNSITSDPDWSNGDYYGKNKDLAGFAIARMVGHITYLSEEGMDQKFGRRLQGEAKNYSYIIKNMDSPKDPDLEKKFDREFEVESYLAHQGKKFVNRFDANSYLYLTKAMDYFNVEDKYGSGSLSKAMKRVKAETMLISFTSDWLYSPDESRKIVEALRSNNKDVSYLEIKSKQGHDAFLLEKKTVAENKILSQAIKNFISHIQI